MAEGSLALTAESLPRTDFQRKEERHRRMKKVFGEGELAAFFRVRRDRLTPFPDFAFQLTPDEWSALRSQIAALTSDPNLKSQIATSSLSHGGRRKLPVVFTEHGALRESL
jgi:hypothetical protein